MKGRRDKKKREEKLSKKTEAKETQLEKRVRKERHERFGGGENGKKLEEKEDKFNRRKMS